jgi:hypothetical protein
VVGRSFVRRYLYELVSEGLETGPGGGPVSSLYLRQCREWLERLDRGERVVVNLRPETDPETEYVAFDRPRVLRVLARIIADLDDLAGFPPLADEEKGQAEGAKARRIHHRQRLAEPEPPPKRLSMREERAALRALLDLPSSEKG